MSKVVKELAKVLKNDTTEKLKPYDTSAEVIRIDGGTAWVHIPGGVDETPVELTINAKVGDTVQLRVSGGNAWIVGNKTAPPTDDRVAIQAQGTAEVANVAAQNAVKAADNAEEAAQSALSSAATAATAATNAQNSANAAQISANNANEYATRALNGLSAVESVTETLNWITAHGTMTLTSDVTLDPTHVYFVIDPLGDYDVGGTHYSLVIDPDVDDIGTYYELSIDESLNNYVGTHLALDTEGLWLLPASSGTNKVLIATGAGSTYTTAGTYIINSGGGVEASFRSNGATVGENSSGKTRSEIGTGGMQIIQNVSGVDTSIANLGYGPGTDSGGGTSNAPYYTLGYRNGTVGNWSVAEGNYTQASGAMSHSEGQYTTANSYCAHSEGSNTSARANAAHSEGNETRATGDFAHAQNNGTTAQRKSQTALGEYNVLDTTGTTATRGQYSVIVGNGTADNTRSNALTIDWSGNVDIASGAKYKINGSNLSAPDVGAVPTSRTVNGKALSSNITLSASDVGALASSSVADYITSKGTNGNWYYEKWNSGKIEAVFKGSVTYGTMSASGQLYRSTNNAVAIPSGIFSTTPQRTEITINNASTVVVCATAVASSTTNVNVQVWRSTNAASSIDATIRCTYTP